MKAKCKIRIIFIGVLLACGLNFHLAFAGDKYLIPGDARRGWRVFSEKGCIQCHAMGDKGRVIIAPDLSKSPSVHLSSAGLAAQMWNHAPEMWEKMSAKWVGFKRLNETEMADLFAFLYVMRYLDEPGDPAKGKEILKAKGCIDCHSIGEKRGGIGPDLAMWKEFTNPILWVQMMWNHALKMKDELDKGAKAWPTLGRNDIVDIIAYIASLNKKTSQERAFLTPGDPAEGKKMFSKKGCGQCHATEGTGRRKGPSLGMKQKDFPPTIGQFASLMWNHFPGMFSEMQKEKIKVPVLSAQDIANITSYLFSIRYFDPAGNRVQGKNTFQERRCSICHNIQKNAEGKKEGPNLAKLKGVVSPIYMATALWNHGPRMIGSMKEKNIKWQKITDKELINLMEYINQGD
ncbi:MAG TPA: c-type cytochrome [Syntrophales bacterium]|nr:c-type cytochrome [Syntrophales bacterium]